MAAPRRVFGYCRVSSAGQEKSGTSLEGQRDEITRWCAAQGYPAPTLERAEPTGKRGMRIPEWIAVIGPLFPGTP